MNLHPNLPDSPAKLSRLFEPALAKPAADPAMSGLPERFCLSITETWAGRPIAGALAAMGGLTENLARELIEFGALWSGPRPVEPGHRPRNGELLILNRPLYGPRLFYRAAWERIIYQDDHLLVYNKEPGLPCQSTPYDGRNQALEAVRSLLGLKRLWLVHRLDAPTSGLIIMAKTKTAAAALSAQFRGQTAVKTYLALTVGSPDTTGPTRVELPISKVNGRYQAGGAQPGRPAATNLCPLPFRPPEKNRLFFQARPLSGRTHQIRLHLAAIGRPIVGDPIYGGPPHPRLMLTAFALEFRHPATKRLLKLNLPLE